MSNFLTFSNMTLFVYYVLSNLAYLILLLLAIYSLGLAVPFLLTSLGIDRFLAFYGRFRRHLHTVEVVSGVLLIIVGALSFIPALSLGPIVEHLILGH